MNKQFVTYEIAILLKELGFDEEVLRWYDHQRKDKTMYVSILKKDMDKHIPAPLWQQAIDWFREKHKLQIHINSSTLRNGEFTDYVGYINGNAMNDRRDEEYDTFEKARYAVILKAIELIKNKAK